MIAGVSCTLLSNSSGASIFRLDITDATKTTNVSPAITVIPAQYTPATGGDAIPADNATGTFTSLTGPSYSENNTAEIGAGTIILNVPGGFIFDTGGTAPRRSWLPAPGAAPASASTRMTRKSAPPSVGSSGPRQSRWTIRP